AVKPYMEAYIFNRNFMGLPVSRKSYFGSQEGIVPQYKLATNKTNPLLVDLAKWLNKISGGGDYTTSEISFDPESGDVGRNGWKSWGDLNPAKFEHLIEGIFGGRLTFFNNIWKTAKSVISEEEVETVNIPVLRRLYQSPYGSSAWEKFYEVRDQVANIDAKANEFMKLGDYDNFIKVNSYKNASLVNVYKSYEKMIRRLNKAINLTKEGSLTDMLKKQREDLVKDFALKMKEMEKKTSKKNVLVE
ncbi:LPD38 domain-containing protein, partial [Dysgonomonas capnocytophagoides]|uniref:LPD38 domain-containing protein n=1 Tax=Dysgonomonas capnocytophagoides TaxID=45254 RepID=UPI002A8324A9